VSQSLSRWQSIVLGAVVLAAIALTGFGLTRMAARQGIWTDTIEVTVAFPEVHDVTLGTPVRVRGIDAGRVVAIDYPAHDGEGAAVTVRMKIDARFADRLYADGSAQIHATGLLGSKVIAVSPGTPTSGSLVDGKLKATSTPDLAQAIDKLTATADKIGSTADKLGTTADEAKLLIQDARTGTGTVAKLIADDGLYKELTGLAKDSRAMVKRADAAVGVVEQKAADVDRFVQDGRDTLKSVKQGTNAVQKLPIIRGYVGDAAALLTRPDCRKESTVYNTTDLFEPDTAILTEAGRNHVKAVATWLQGVKNDKAEVVVAALCDPAAKGQTPASAAELTKKQAEAIVEQLKTLGAHKTGWWSRRKLTPIGLAQGPSPVIETKPMPASYVQVLLFTPQ